MHVSLREVNLSTYEIQPLESASGYARLPATCTNQLNHSTYTALSTMLHRTPKSTNSEMVGNDPPYLFSEQARKTQP